jgi:hypothetical protein
MTKSRTALVAVGPALLLAAPASAQAQSGPATAEEALAAYEQRVDEVMGGSVAATCNREGEDEEIVVCGRSSDARMRIPYEPEPGARRRLIAGEAPSAAAALNAGACCGQGGGLDVIAIVRTLSRGLDRILHPD